MVRPFRRILASWLLLISPMVACSLTIPTAAPAQPSTENPYRYDELPNQANESAIISDWIPVRCGTQILSGKAMGSSWTAPFQS
jgi:hypothetical protein